MASWKNWLDKLEVLGESWLSWKCWVELAVGRVEVLSTNWLGRLEVLSRDAANLGVFESSE